MVLECSFHTVCTCVENKSALQRLIDFGMRSVTVLMTAGFTPPRIQNGPILFAVGSCSALTLNIMLSQLWAYALVCTWGICCLSAVI